MSVEAKQDSLSLIHRTPGSEQKNSHKVGDHYQLRRGVVRDARKKSYLDRLGKKPVSDGVERTGATAVNLPAVDESVSNPRAAEQTAGGNFRFVTAKISAERDIGRFKREH